MKNTARYVAEAAGSVIAQSFTDLELVVVDDGCSDGSREVVERLRDPRVRIVAGPTRGMAAAWNLAFRYSSGEFLMQCDSDDRYPPGRIAEQVAFLDEHPEYGAVCGVFSTVDPAGRPVSDLVDPGDVAVEITAELLAGRTRTSFCTFAVRRGPLEQIGGRREYFRSGSDIDLQLRLAEVCRIWFEPTRRYHWRLHDASLTHSQPSGRVAFFDQYARELRAQRAAGRTDDLDAGVPRPPPDAGSSTSSAGEHVQGMLLGKAWRAHARGERLGAIRIGLRALSHAPANPSAWRSVAALLLKSSRTGPR